MVFFDLQFIRIVFWAIVRATSSRLLFVLSMLIDDKSPNSVGDNGMRQPRKWDSDSVTSFQKQLICVQSQVA